MSDDRYTIEKRCISVEDVSGMLEKAEGCGTAGDVNFCLCKTDLCNGASLLQQARLQGFQESLNEQPTSDKIPQGPEIAKSNSGTPPPVFLEGENEETTQLDRKAIDTAVGRLEEEERKLEERRKQWIVGSGEDISSVGLRNSFISLCTTGITFIILRIL
ncbi:hypothetical protein WR25_23689 isoform B [Diploscapter pachys]|uniref:Uncharacterized protein n=1 Tax=Diploscapter pachys TaxID=2018661 RepID=A0A2A2JZQ3_9BILA|nr:hypothetical protein WR25_23689 isoform A [Diploscapter pachys]PAV67111.1 hypothetical protein WR25_23689 isoform B [Diploscapter pachys]